jgi:hypothetical protein
MVGNSITNQPQWVVILGPHLSFGCRPYPTVIKNKIIKIIAAIPIVTIIKILKNIGSFGKKISFNIVGNDLYG